MHRKRDQAVFRMWPASWPAFCCSGRHLLNPGNGSSLHRFDYWQLLGVDLPRGTLKKGLENGTHHSVAMGTVLVPTKPEGPAIVTNPNETRQNNAFNVFNFHNYVRSHVECVAELLLACFGVFTYFGVNQ